MSPERERTRADLRAAVVEEPLDPRDVLARVGDPGHGAVVLFVGTVRNLNEGRPVTAVRYDAYADMAREVLEEIAREAAERLRGGRIAVTHRVGELSVGEASVAIAVSAPHRAEAYDASRFVIEEIKKRLPVWKKERYRDGEDRWLEGEDPRARERSGNGTGEAR